MSPIGGYFSLDLAQEGPFPHQDGVLLNTGRNALEYILRSLGNVRCLWMPFYTCDVIMEPVEKLGISYHRYHIDEQLEIVGDIVLKEGDYLLYTNYFGLKSAYISQLATRYGNSLIVDNAQAWFDDPLDGVSTFYSPRKFFGLPDGGVAYCSSGISIESFERDESFDRCSHLLKRIDLGASEGYADFKKNSLKLVQQPIRRMSVLTEKFMTGIDYEAAKERRRVNYKTLDAALHGNNLLRLPLYGECVPMVYPFLAEDSALKQRLIENCIFVATYWPNVMEWCKEGELEYRLAKNTCYLPIDQRYDVKEMNMILEITNY